MCAGIRNIRSFSVLITVKCLLVIKKAGGFCSHHSFFLFILYMSESSVKVHLHVLARSLFAKLCTHTLCIGEKRTLRSRHMLNLGVGQMLLPMSYWSSGIGVEDR